MPNVKKIRGLTYPEPLGTPRPVAGGPLPFIDTVTTLLEYMVTLYCNSGIFAPFNRVLICIWTVDVNCATASRFINYLYSRNTTRGGNVCLWRIKWYKQQWRRLYLLNTLHTLQLQGLSVRPSCRFPTIQPADSTRYRGGREVAALAWVGARALSCQSIYRYLFCILTLTLEVSPFTCWQWSQSCSTDSKCLCC